MTIQPEIRATELSFSWGHFVPRDKVRLDLQLTGVCDEAFERYLYEGFLAGKRYTFALIDVDGPVPKVVPGSAFNFAPERYLYSDSVCDGTKTVFR